MSSKRVELPGSALCPFSFTDGRRCALPAHPDNHGFCLPHASRRGRTPRRDKLTRNLENLGREDLSESEIFLALETVQRSLTAASTPTAPPSLPISAKSFSKPSSSPTNSPSAPAPVNPSKKSANFSTLPVPHPLPTPDRHARSVFTPFLDSSRTSAGGAAPDSPRREPWET